MVRNGNEDLKSRFSLTNPFRRRGDSANKQPSPISPPPADASANKQPSPIIPPPAYARETPSSQTQYQPLPGKLPSASQYAGDLNPPEYAPWMAIPDTSLFPPPPSMPHRASPSANATFDSLLEAKRWCINNPLSQPRHLPDEDRERLNRLDISLSPPPPSFHGQIHQFGPGTWNVHTLPTCDDTILITDIPLYSALSDNPTLTNHPKTLYFELKVLSTATSASSSSGSEAAAADAGIALGFLAPPYPHWRLPGWERASLGVHGDDGRKYVHNSLGGQDLTTPFRHGEIVGIGMTFKPNSGCNSRLTRPAVEVFFTREGECVGKWDLHEERDLHDEGSVAGLEGENDLLGAVGMFGHVEFETRFRRDQWLYRPPLS